MTSITIPEGSSIQESNRKTYTAAGGGGETDFDIPFPFFATSDITVYKDGTLLTEGTDYNITGTAVVGGYQSGTVVLLVAAVSVDVIVIRETPIERLSDFPASGPFPMDQLNLTLDKLYAIQQRLRTDQNRALRLSDNDSTETVVLPDTADRAEKYLYFDAAGVPTAVTQVLPGSVSITPFAETFLDDADAAAVQTTLEVMAKEKVYGNLVSLPAAVNLNVSEQYNIVRINSGGTISGLPDSLNDGTEITIYIASASTLTHNTGAGTGYDNLFLPGGADISALANDSATFKYVAVDNLWRCINYTRATGNALVETASTDTALRDSHRGLSITDATTTTLSISADEVILQTSAGVPMQALAVSETLNAGSVGANGLDAGSLAVDTWYGIYVIGKADGTVDTLLSTNLAGAPTLPSGYTYLALVGAVLTDNSSLFEPFLQIGRDVVYTSAVVIKNTGFTTTTWTGLTTTAFFPNTAKKVRIQMNDSIIMAISPVSTGHGAEMRNSANGINTSFDGISYNADDHATFEIPYDGSQIFYYTGTAGTSMIAAGWSY